MMRRIFTAALLVLSALSAAAQNTVSGTVRYAGNGSSVSGVNVIVREAGRNAILGYATSGEDGRYSVSYKSGPDSLNVSVTGFNIKKLSKTIAAGTSTVDFVVEYARQEIREVKITAEAIKEQGDTLTYYVENFKDHTDRSIGDVLKKLPGIQVTPGGGIKYQGKEINKFYIEGLDMLGGRYGIAVNNVQASDIAAVEVYENHQPIKMLRDWVKSDRAAINLRLKSRAKGAWNAVLQLGTGYKPWLWNAEAVPMFFGQRFQTITTYKTNNTGEDVARELNSFVDGSAEIASLLYVTTPTAPPVNENRYLDNDIHSVSVNAIHKVGEDGDLTADASYVHDLQESAGTTVSSYFLPDGSTLVIPESIESGLKKDKVGFNVQYRLNADKAYVLEQLSFNGKKNVETAAVSSDDDVISQYLSMPDLRISNKFNWRKSLEQWRLNFKSDVKYQNSPSFFRISPNPYPDLFGAGPEYDKAYQGVDTESFKTDNTFSASYRVRKWSFSLAAKLNADIENLLSSLSAMSSENVPSNPADSMKNSIAFQRYDAILEPSVTYNVDRFSASLLLPFDLARLHQKDEIRKKGMSETDFLVSPSLSMLWQIRHDLRMFAFASWTEQLGGMFDNYDGYIMSGYRNIGKKDGPTNKRSRQYCSADLNYRNALHGLFASLAASGWRAERNVMYGTDYSGILSTTTATRMDNVSSGAGVDARISKRINPIATTVSLSGGWNGTWSDYLRQGSLMTGTYHLFSAGLKVDSKIGKAAVFSYDGNYSRTLNRIADTALPAIDNLRQSAGLDFIFGKKVMCGVKAEHYFNATIQGQDRNIFFLDALLSLKHGRWEYILEGRNLLDRNTFTSATYNENANYVYARALRPASVMLKVRFSLR